MLLLMLLLLLPLLLLLLLLLFLLGPLSLSPPRPPLPAGTCFPRVAAAAVRVLGCTSEVAAAAAVAVAAAAGPASSTQTDLPGSSPSRRFPGPDLRPSIRAPFPRTPFPFPFPTPTCTRNNHSTTYIRR